MPVFRSSSSKGPAGRLGQARGDAQVSQLSDSFISQGRFESSDALPGQRVKPNLFGQKEHATLIGTAVSWNSIGAPILISSILLFGAVVPSAQQWIDYRGKFVIQRRDVGKCNRSIIGCRIHSILRQNPIVMVVSFLIYPLHEKRIKMNVESSPTWQHPAHP
jgi:hypothetical protein